LSSPLPWGEVGAHSAPGEGSQSIGNSRPPHPNPLAAGKRELTEYGASVIQEAAEFPRARRVLELAQRLGLDLADALAGDRELLADFLERVIGVHADAEAHAQHA